MERPEDIRSNRYLLALHERTANWVRIIVIFHLIGLAGLYFSPTKPYFLQLVPYHLLLMAVILIINHDRLNLKFLYFFVAIFIAGWLIEYFGVRTGQLFGDYSYGKTLGFSIKSIPVLMGINWFILIYSAAVSMQLLRIRSMLFRIFFGAGLLVVLDFLIEPVAARLNYWHWVDNEVPLQNYLCWFIVSAVLLFVFEQFKFKKQSMVGPAILICQFIFFALLQ
ncbi:carotenoid biosynthesis protein [Mucilaginibacter sp. dw_454]|uniref:carotenoid biosynthesis protein n=1 Tax=Mucilaginibacter sp. dw_454 TaxID=2720079 RepID=UPI001BD2D228|nr:carotenoid biosynthesis protein [Mucilaginibacter sp. dw_454]